MDDKEWTKLGQLGKDPTKAKVCKFFNSTIGCKMDKCKFAHKCLVCGAGHSAASAHNL
jgi:hypothetical protein